MPESVKNRPTRCHEQVFLLTKNRDYFFDAKAIEEPAICADDKRSGAGRIRYGGKRNGGAGTGQESFVSIKETRNKRTVWTIAVQHFKGAHFAIFPEKLVEPCVLAGSKPSDIILDPFSGAGTTGLVAVRYGRNYIGLELNPAYAEMSMRRVADAVPSAVRNMLPGPLPSPNADAGVGAGRVTGDRNNVVAGGLTDNVVAICG
jgi:DNA modification methylase